MAKSVVIVESPAKAKTIHKYLGRGFAVVSSMGHVRDLPKSEIGINYKKNFEPKYVLLPEKRKIVTRLKKEVAGAGKVYLALDLDREGEAIAWHLKEVLKIPDGKAHRITFNEITKKAIDRAMKNPGRIDQNKVDAQQARRLLDRIVGYELSPLLWGKVLKGLSAGRVQSVATKLIVDREKEIRAFVPREFWKVTATLSSPDDPEQTFEAELKEIDGRPLEISSEAEARAIVDELAGEPFAVSSLDIKTKEDRPPPPFITSSLQQAASIRLRFSTRKTMLIAQQLYEGVELGSEGSVGLITYMRTDSFNVAREALDEAREIIQARFGDRYLPGAPNVFKSRKTAQEAHEAIRPTDPSRPPDAAQEHMNRAQHALYRLIWERFIGSQMAPAIIDVTRAEIRAGRATFVASGRILRFDGHTLLNQERHKENVVLPSLTDGMALTCRRIDPTQHFTQPPKRYSEAGLVRALEREGIGRPSTYATIISTIQDRGYVELHHRRFHATDLGILVTDKLEKHFPDIMNTEFTAQMEDKLDAVEDARDNWVAVLKDFHAIFSSDLARARKEMRNVNRDPEPSDETCEKCGKPLVYLWNKRGRFLGCSGYPDCSNTKSVDENGKAIPEEEISECCERCGKPFVVRTGRNGRFLACSGYPECRNTRSLQADGTPAPEEDIQAEPCEKCGAEMMVKFGPHGRFLACSRYPECRTTRGIHQATGMAQEVTEESCPKCGKPMVVRVGRRGRFLACSGFPQCRSTKSLPRTKKEAPQQLEAACDKCGAPMVLRAGQRGEFAACSAFPKCRNTKPLDAITEGKAKEDAASPGAPGGPPPGCQS